MKENGFLHTLNIKHYAQHIMQRCDILARISEEPGCLTRRYATPALQQANELVASWMREAGMTVVQDQIGNLRGRYEADRPGAKTLLLGSHLDTVRDAGRYDGILGVLIALTLIQHLSDSSRRLPFAIEVLSFADEEGARYHTAYLGSSTVAGSFNMADLTLTDEQGVTLADAIRAFGGDPTRLAEDQRAAEDLLGYCEVHIEQGPILEALNLPVGIVTAITGQSRFALRFSGFAGHAGTVPMPLRQDALCGAAEFVLACEGLARQTTGLVATVGQLSVHPSVSNVIPGFVECSLDLRHQDNAIREQACILLQAQALHIAEQRNLDLSWQSMQAKDAVACDSALTALLAQAVASTSFGIHMLPSGAGHDGVLMSKLTPIAMLFVRCAGGISHNPAETVTVEDLQSALIVMIQFLELLGTQEA